MFTQCYKCETIFRLSAQALRTAGGQVRCGRCGEVFNALTRLAEDATGFNQGESPLDLEARADEILHTVEPVAPIETATAGGGDSAHLEVIEPLDDESMPEGSLEFTLPPGELDRVFIETAPNVMQLLAAERLKAARGSAPAADGTPAGAPAAATPPAATLNTATPLAATPVTATPLAAPPAPPAMPAATPLAAATAAAAAAAQAPAAAWAADSPRPDSPRTHAMPSDPLAAAGDAVRMTGFEVSENVRREMLAGFAHAELPRINEPRRRLPLAAWISAAVLLTLVLAGQLLLGNREWLSAYLPALADGASAATLSAYQLQQWGVTGEPGASGTLRVRATIMNTAAQLQPYPLLRVTLANRFGASVAQREFEPSEYTGRSTARMLSPGERANATLDILDPGKDAEGFEIDLCLRTADARLRCAADAAARTR